MQQANTPLLWARLQSLDAQHALQGSIQLHLGPKTHLHAHPVRQARGQQSAAMQSRTVLFFVLLEKRGRQATAKNAQRQRTRPRREKRNACHVPQVQAVQRAAPSAYATRATLVLLEGVAARVSQESINLRQGLTGVSPVDQANIPPHLERTLNPCA